MHWKETQTAPGPTPHLTCHTLTGSDTVFPEAGADKEA